mmetsp:Transcript_38227/g.74806  ORF Transcript_38227/g.74806 Transcript_38227/m.74806 type:complete len:156 (-) Transcript_38227:1477-1944(-)
MSRNPTRWMAGVPRRSGPRACWWWRRTGGCAGPGGGGAEAFLAHRDDPAGGLPAHLAVPALQTGLVLDIERTHDAVTRVLPKMGRNPSKCSPVTAGRGLQSLSHTRVTRVTACPFSFGCLGPDKNLHLVRRYPRPPRREGGGRSASVCGLGLLQL